MHLHTKTCDDPTDDRDVDAIVMSLLFGKPSLLSTCRIVSGYIPSVTQIEFPWN